MLLLVTSTEAPPVGAGPLRVIVIVALPPLATVEGLIVSEVMVGRVTGGGVTVTVALWLELLYVAVTVTAVELVTVPACVWKLKLLWPAWMLMGDETRKAELLLLESVTEATPVGTNPLRLMVTVALVPLATVEGLIVSEVMVGRVTGGGVTVTVALWLELLYVAVTVTAVELVTVPACVWKLKLLWPAW